MTKIDTTYSNVFKRSTRKRRQISPGVYSCGHQVTHQINIYELISVCSCPGNMQMISETVNSRQTKLIGQSLHVWEHRIGYLNLAFEAKKGQKRLILGFKPLKRLEGLEIRIQSINIKKFITKNPLKVGNFHFVFIADEGNKGQNLVLAT